MEILHRIDQFEREGRFDEDVEQDPPGRMLMPDEIEYVRKTKAEKLKTKVAFKMAHKFIDELIEENKFIIKEIKGVETFKKIGINDVFGQSGKPVDLLKEYELTGPQIADKIGPQDTGIVTRYIHDDNISMLFVFSIFRYKIRH